MTRYRWTGISAPFGGLQWERKDDDREIARRVLNLLSDRRMLWKDFSLEIEEHCVTSANKIRDQLGEQMNNPEIGTDLARRLQLLQRLFRDFVDHIGPASSDRHRHWQPLGTDPLSMALGRLRWNPDRRTGRRLQPRRVQRAGHYCARPGRMVL